MDLPLHVATAMLGPVLLIRSCRPLSAPIAHLSIRLDSFGPRESLVGRDFRIYRLPDSDFFGWERLAARLPWCEQAGPPSSEFMRAGVVRGQRGGWTGVSRLSALGWEVCSEILASERAQLCPSVWRE
jgi:hypothetical protein